MHIPPLKKRGYAGRRPYGSPPKITQALRETPLPKIGGDYVARKKELTKEQRIKKEERRLREICTNIPDDVKGVADGLIREAAYMRVQLEDYRKDLDDKGYVEMFTQSEKTDPYERERPVARLYSTLNKNYQSILKQLSDLLPKPAKGGKPGETDDGFDGFVASK